VLLVRRIGSDSLSFIVKGEEMLRGGGKQLDVRCDVVDSGIGLQKLIGERE
jgi:hypothetical protein